MVPNEPRSQRAALRAAFRRVRRGLDAECSRAHAAAVARHALARIGREDRVAAYLARDGELDLAPLISGCWRRGIVVALPVLTGRRMCFAEHRCGAELVANRYGIPEPAEPQTVVPTIVFAPVVAFDGRGHRLGMGGGYYDRYFAASPQVVRVGVAHECQRAAELPMQPWDVPLGAVVTENGWQRCF